jgi:hypothetical protein
MTGNESSGEGLRKHRFRIAAWSAAVLLLLLPLIAMQFSDQVNWDAADFAVFGAMLAGVGFTLELVAAYTRNNTYRIAVGIALVSAFALVFVNLAVGVIGTENSTANLMFGGVLAIGVIGAVLVRFEPAGMAYAMFATAVAQALVAVIALIARFGSTGPAWLLDSLIMTGFFTGLWLLSGWLFRKAARIPSSVETELEFD